ncbi:mitochondrial carrier domain-containing protein [Lipomyces arxii]|uniref:mitochondrial carrier domain-containing protein n=1 Tax=Lipomyces arxii TaxID=56418 RepID=UPI0034CEE8FD
MEEEVQIIEAVEQNDSVSPLRVLKDVSAGTCGGIAQVLVGQPFDTTKVRLQSAPTGTYNGALDVVRNLVKNEGFRGFYKGTLTPLIGVGFCVSMQFGVFEGMKRMWARQNVAAGNPPDLKYSQYYFSGTAAGFMNAFLTCPIEHVRIRLQTQTAAEGQRQFNGPLDVVRQAKQAAGIRGVFRGFGPTLCREAHGMGIYFLTYEYLVNRDMRTNSIARTEIPSWRLCIYGGCAGYSVWMSAYPFDVVKSKMQTDSIDPAKRRYVSMADGFKQTFREFGLKGFFRGFGPTMLRAAPVNASTFCAFEFAMRTMG